MINMLIIAISPTLALLFFIYQKDRYDREPPGLLFKLFIFGALSVIPVYFIERFLTVLNFYNSPLYTAFIVAGLTEETFKYIIVIYVAYKSRHYDEKLDGIVYSVFVSLGFAGVENILYVLSSGASYISTGATRAIFSVPAHMLFAITMGYYLSLAKFSRGHGVSKRYSLRALYVPIILHGIYDYILMAKMVGFFVIFILFVFYLWRVNLNRLNRYVIESRMDNDDLS